MIKRGNKYDTNNNWWSSKRRAWKNSWKRKTKGRKFPWRKYYFILPKIPTILDNEDFEIKQEIKKQKDHEINEEIVLTRLKDEIDAREVPKEIEFYFCWKSSNFFLMCSLGLNKDNENFIDFLSLVIGSQIFRENMLWKQVFFTIAITQVNQYTIFC